MYLWFFKGYGFKTGQDFYLSPSFIFMMKINWVVSEEYCPPANYLFYFAALIVLS